MVLLIRMKLSKCHINIGIEVFNLFLSQDPITEDVEQTIHNIYGQYAIFVEGVAHLPGHLSPHY